MLDSALLTAVSRVTGIPVNRIIKTKHCCNLSEVDARCLAVLAKRTLAPALAVVHLGEFVGLGHSSGSLALKRGNARFHESADFRRLARQLFVSITDNL